ncbi:MAG: tetratricopeptide repeat protein, partial [Planctomycetota bacterium]
MRRAATCLIVTVLLTGASSAAWAQADAKAAFDAGKAAYAKGDFEKAREQFERASKTDVRNPEVFLWLGRSHHQLGQVNDAVAAWTRTLALAPNEPYAKKMLDALRGQLAKIDTKIRLIEAVLGEELYSTARTQCQVLLAEKALTDAQRAKVLTLQAAALVEMNRVAEAVAVLQEIAVRHGAHADPAKTALLLGLAKMGARATPPAEGLALLRKVLADHAGTPEGARAEYELIAWRMGEWLDDAAAADLKKWLAANPNHPQARTARRRLMGAYLTLARRLPRPKEGAALADLETQAIALAVDLLSRAMRAPDARALVKQIRSHLTGRYVRPGAYAAAIAGTEALLKAPLARADRLDALPALASWRTELALRQLTRQAAGGKLPGGPTPKVLADAVAAYEAVGREFPAGGGWAQLAALARRVNNLAETIPWPVRVTAPKAPQGWALEIALRVVKADADAAAVTQAARTVTAIVDELAKLTPPAGRGLALAVHTRLLAALSPDHSAWTGTVLKQLDLLDANARGVFADNVRTGRGADNAKPNEYQQRMLASMAKLVGRHADQGANALARLRRHLPPWTGGGHYELARGMYEQLAPALRPRDQRAARLAVAGLWAQEVAASHRRLQSAGLKVPRKLDAGMVEALRIAYALQDGLEEGDEFLAQARAVWDSVVDHYRGLKYFDVAAEAVKVRPPAAAAAGEAHAS